MFLSPLEAGVVEAVRARTGPRPRVSGALVLAARELADRAARGARDPLSRGAVRDALARGLSYDPAPEAYLVQASPSRLGEMIARAVGGDRREGLATHLGAGVVEVDGLATAVVLTSQRRARLDPFPREVAAGGSAVLSGELGPGLRAARVFVGLPSGQVEEREVAGAFRATVLFPARGRYLVEVVAEAASGPTVAVLAAVAAGGASLDVAREDDADDPADPIQAEKRVADALSALRERSGLPALQVSAPLSELARRHSAAMRAAGSVGHLVPGSGAVAFRLSQAGIRYRRVLENVAAARTALAAHEEAAESPAHRRNMLNPQVSEVGIGIARETLPSGDPRVYLTEILTEPAGGDTRLAPEGRVRDELSSDRARRGLSPLVDDAPLDELARSFASELVRRDERGEPELVPSELTPRALALPREQAAVDLFVAAEPREATRSPNLRDRRFRRVGVGVVEGASRRFGPGRLFIAVVYSD